MGIDRLNNKLSKLLGETIFLDRSPLSEVIEGLVEEVAKSKSLKQLTKKQNLKYTIYKLKMGKYTKKLSIKLRANMKHRLQANKEGIESHAVLKENITVHASRKTLKKPSNPLNFSIKEDLIEDIKKLVLSEIAKSSYLGMGSVTHKLNALRVEKAKSSYTPKAVSLIINMPENIRTPTLEELGLKKATIKKEKHISKLHLNYSKAEEVFQLEALKDYYCKALNTKRGVYGLSANSVDKALMMVGEYDSVIGRKIKDKVHIHLLNSKARVKESIEAYKARVELHNKNIRTRHLLLIKELEEVKFENC